jgi:hypothetical protein
MEVSAISAVSPSQIDWRKLTAKEIIKYENQGVQVPDEYLQWAKAFIDNISASDNDETTYEEASEQKSSDTTVNSASAKREQMEASGANLYTIGMRFVKDSLEKSSESEDAVEALTAIEQASNSQMSSVESSISEILSKADELNAKMESLLSQKNTNKMTQIKELQGELKKLGISGQALLAGTDTDMNEYQSEIRGQSSIGPETINYGEETVSIGDELQQKGFLFLIGSLGQLGNFTIQEGTKAIQATDSANLKNVESRSKIHSLEASVQAKTGIDNISESSETDKDQENDNDKKQEEQQTEQQTDQQKALASSNIETILQYKIRKGETLNS